MGSVCFLTCSPGVHIKQVEEDLDGQVAISVEIESSRIRLFSSTSLEERPGFNQINPMKAAWDTIHNLIDSYRGEQVTQ